MRNFRRFLLFILIFLGHSTGYGLYFNSPSVLEPRKTTFSLAPYITFDHEGGLFLINDYGLIRDLNTVLKAGWIRTGINQFYAGAELKYLILEHFGGTDNFTILLGGHYVSNFGMDLGLALGNEY
ncbi:MAG: hypothetical protein PHF84_06950, partial [bacterium]|nr:hypothetical protein [bacterium]